jgi:LmbE family N-acetylglucosaminyl deacetylase
MKKCLIIAAHPDDDILGCGGILNRFRKTVDFKVVFIAEGSSVRFKDPQSEECLQAESLRMQSAISALEYLNVSKYQFYDFPCCKLDTVGHLEITRAIEKEITSHKPDIVFTHSDSDSNIDHKIVYNSTIIATRPNSGVEHLVSYEVLSSTEWGFKNSFTPNLFYKLSKEDIKTKIEALRHYTSEMQPFPHPRSDTAIESLAQFRGAQCGHKYAEAFRTIRSFL